MTHTALLLFTSLLLWAPAQAAILCTWTKVLPHGELHYNFLRQDSSSLRLYHSVWSEERAPLSCSWSDDAALIQNYLSLCRERAHEFSERPDGNLNVNLLLEAEDQCVSLASQAVAWHGERTGKRPVRSAGGLPAATSIQGQDERSEVRSHQRVKRGFIVPGTLWCGSGNKAPSYDDLGVFGDTDSCCREHDQCKHTILSFHSEFGVFNTNIFTMSHCECDNKFRSCLMQANDSISHVVGYTFFNLLKMHCFEFSHRLQCTQRNWFGMCKETQMSLYAEVHPPTLFEYTSSTEVSMNSTSYFINTTTPAQLQGSSTSDPQFFSITEAASTVPTPSTSLSSTFIAADASTVPTPSTNLSSTFITEAAPTVLTPSTSLSSTFIAADASTVPTPSTSLSSTFIAAAASTVPTPSTSLPSAPPASITPVTNVSTSMVTSTSERTTDTLSTKIQTATALDSDLTEKLLSCDIFKDLDECRNKILPLENRYGLHNPEPRTLYHCNCTTRLFQTLAEPRRLTEVHALLLEHVSQSCFLTRDCTAGNTCTAVLVKAEFPYVMHRSGAEVEEQRHLQAVKLKVRRPNSSRAKRKDRVVRLHKLCFRMTRRKMNKTRKQNAQRQTAAGREPV
ncbi:group 3 secretory phospholipase A2 [Anabas testudineus]|uniref:group 3 secretory phospholipase A2 n=1 Tax=Anabas testudineus TaxID=64144 RepID=UPI000E465C45|nr:group 3 secretory phospholipase A2 [Anabas testudineus]